MLAVGPEAASGDCAALQAAGCEIMRFDDPNPQSRLEQLFIELGRRRMTNVLIEGGGQLFGSLFDAGMIDEVHVFIAPKLAGERDPGPIAGRGVEAIAEAMMIEEMVVREIAGDIYIKGAAC